MKERTTAGKTAHQKRKEIWGVPVKVREEAWAKSRQLLRKMKGRLRDGTHALGRNMEKAGRILQEIGERGGQRHH